MAAQSGQANIKEPTFRRTAKSTLTGLGKQMLAQTGGVIKGKDPEAIHQMRVASRRLRAALDLFGCCFQRAQTRALRRETKDVTSALGAARDLDVLIGYLKDYEKASPAEDRPALDKLIRTKKRERSRLQAHLKHTVKALSGSHLQSRIKAYARSAHNSHPLTTRDPDHIDLPAPDSPLRAFAPPLLMPRLETMLSWLPQARASGDPEPLHSMRIDAKRLRYALEPFQPVFGPDFTGIIEEVRRLQDLLGELHDCDVWSTLVTDFAGSSEAEDGPYSRLSGHLKTRRDEVFKEFKGWWSPGKELKFRRRFVQAINPPAAAAAEPAEGDTPVSPKLTSA